MSKEKKAKKATLSSRLATLESRCSSLAKRLDEHYNLIQLEKLASVEVAQRLEHTREHLRKAAGL